MNGLEPRPRPFADARLRVGEKTGNSTTPIRREFLLRGDCPRVVQGGMRRAMATWWQPEFGTRAADCLDHRDPDGQAALIEEVPAAVNVVVAEA